MSAISNVTTRGRNWKEYKNPQGQRVIERKDIPGLLKVLVHSPLPMLC